MIGIKKRLIFNYMLIMLVVISILEAVFFFMVRGYYYGAIQQNAANKLTVTSGFYSKYSMLYQGYIEEAAKRINDEFLYKENGVLQVLDLNGNIIVSSKGFSSNIKVDSIDYKSALNNRIASWVGSYEDTKEKIIAVSVPLRFGETQVIGVLRYIVSLEAADREIMRVFLVSVPVIGILFIVIFIMSIIFSKSIINPINEITAVSKNMARGQFKERIQKKYNDEIGVLADTLNYMAEEISRAQELKNEFISSISHELRTPLTSITGWSETIMTGDMENKEETQKGLRIIIKETKRLTQMVEELLDFSRLESGRLMLQLESVDSRSELEELLVMQRARAQKEGLIVEYDCVGDIPKVLADRNRLRQVFINILDNAIKFTEAGNRIFVTLYEDKTAVCVNIRDQGVGINKEELPKIKEKFYKGSSRKSGSGVGLAVSDEIIKLHGGQLLIQSKSGEGTSVTIAIPKKS